MPLPVTTTRQLMLAPLAALCALACVAHADESRFGFLLQNDVFAGSDGGGYTNGIALAHIRNAAPGAATVAPHWLLAPVAPWLGMGPAALTISSLNQLMITPGDITRQPPDPADAPYLGALWLRAAQVSVSGDVADLLAVDLGMIGPASGARQSQVFIHRITGSDRPQGWDSQVSNRALVGVERYRGIRFASHPDSNAPAADVIVLGGGTLSTLQSSAGGSLLVRYGTGLQRSYPTAMRASGRTADPVVLGRGWFVYGGVHADRVFSHLGLGDNRPANGSTAKLRESQVVGVAGVAYGWTDGALAFSLQSTSALTTTTGRRKGYGSLTYTALLR